MDETSWQKILSSVKPLSVSVAGLLSSAKPLSLEDDKLKLSVFYKFHKDKLEEFKTKKMLEEIALSVLGKEVRIECCLAEAPVVQNSPALVDTSEKSVIKAAEELFG